MATPFDTAATHVHDGDDSGGLIAAYLREAETGRARDAAGNTYSPARLRSLRRSLVPVRAVLGAEELRAAELDPAAVDELAWRVVDRSALAPSRHGSIVEALTSVISYATSQRRADPPTRQRPAPSVLPDPPTWDGPDPPHWEPPTDMPPRDPDWWEPPARPDRARRERPPARPPWYPPRREPRSRSTPPNQPPRDRGADNTARPVSDDESHTPTFTMLTLGAQVGRWVERIIVIAFVLTAIGLALALA